MLILAIDTTATTATAAVADYKDGCIGANAVVTVNTGLTHSESLLPIIDNVLTSCGKNIADVELFAVSVGPGSFTGVRIGVSAVKGLAFDGRPVAAVSTLEALAENIGADGVICPLMDARRGVFYNALFRRENGVLTRLTEDRAISAEELSAELSGMGNVHTCGDGAALFEKLKADNVVTCTPSYAERYQNGLSVALCAGKLYDEGRLTTAAAVAPLYLRKPQAEREREERLAKENK